MANHGFHPTATGRPCFASIALPLAEPMPGNR